MEDVNRMREFFFHTFDAVIKGLEKKQSYKELYEETERLSKAYPIIGKLLYDGNIKDLQGEITQQEFEAIQTYVKLKYDMQNQIEIEYYFRGHKDCLLFLLRCGILKPEV